MKWFKHYSGMLDDLFIVQVMDEFGLEGYGAWVGLLEIYARYCEDNCGEKIEIPTSVFTKKLQISDKKLTKFLHFFEKNQKISYEKISNLVIIEIPKMLELRDEWRSRKSKNSGVTPELLGSNSVPKRLRSKEFKKEETSSSLPPPSENPERGRGRFFQIKTKTESFSESDWIHRQLSEAIRKKGGKVPFGLDLQQLLFHYPSLQKKYARWVAQPLPLRMAAYCFVLQESNADDELYYAISACENKWEKMMEYFPQMEKAVAQQDYEVVFNG